MRLGPWLMLSLGLAVTTACAPTVIDQFDDENGGGPDSDGDGLSNELELELGTNPDLADSDEDGYSDFEEYEAGFDPLDAADRPYTGGWEINTACRSTITSSGNDEAGDVTQNFRLRDQHGDSVQLYDFCDYKAILLVSGAFW